MMNYEPNVDLEEHEHNHHHRHSHDDFAEEKEVFLTHVQKSGLRRTAQRDLILEVFLRTEKHLSSEDLYDLVKKEDPSVGQTTVYRTLKLLTEAGLASEVRFGDGRTHYEHNYNHLPHDHMVCTNCGKIIEFHLPELLTMQNKIAAQHNFAITEAFLRVQGLCENCHDTTAIKPKIARNNLSEINTPLHHK